MFRFLFGRLYLSPDADGGGGAPDAGTTGGGDTAVVADNFPSAAEQQQAATNDLLGGVPEGWSPSGVPRGTSPSEGAGTTDPSEGAAGAGADKNPESDAAATAAAAAAAAAATAPPTVDFTRIAGGKFTDEAALTTFMATAETATATLADPSIQAFVEMAKDPVKAAEYFHELRRDYAAEAKADPFAMLLEDYRIAHPEYDEDEAKALFKREYNDRYPNIGIEDPEDEDYQESAMLRNGALNRAVARRTAEQQAQKDKLAADLPKLAAPAPAAAVLVSDEEIAAHVAKVTAIDGALTARTAKVPVLNAQGQVTGEETLTLPITNREDVNLFMQDTFGYFEKAGITDANGDFNYANLQQFALSAINHQADMQAALQRGIALGVAQGAAALINPGDNPQQQPNHRQGDPATGQGQQQKSTYQQRQERAAQNIPEY